jgi:glycosyltransferase involved in cell wall biosynthesis
VTAGDGSAAEIRAADPGCGESAPGNRPLQQSEPGEGREKTLISVVPFEVEPADTGGKIRVSKLSQGLLRRRWEIFRYVASKPLRRGLREGPTTRTVYSGCEEYIHFNPLIQLVNGQLNKRSFPPVGYDVLPRVLFNTALLRRKLATHRVVMFEHPWLFRTVSSLASPDHFLVYDAHNVERDLYAQMVRGALGEAVLKRVQDVEADAFRRSHLSLVCSGEERDRAVALYRADAERIVVVPNGVDTRAFKPRSNEEKQALRERLGLPSGLLALFVGSRWGPNIEAAQCLLEIARSVHSCDLAFVIAGGVGDSALNGVPDNVTVTGRVDDIGAYFEVCDLAVNPMRSGGGTNIKMLEFMAAGLPVLTTPEGARGLGLRDGEHAMVRAVGDFSNELRRWEAARNERERLGAVARALVETNYDWDAIAGALDITLRDRLTTRDEYGTS